MSAIAGGTRIPAYLPAPTDCPIDLSDNTNRWGVPPAAQRALRQADPALVARYPAPDAGALRMALATYAGVHPEQVVAGCGSDDVLDTALRTLVEPGSRIAFCVPTFSMLPIFAAQSRLEVHPVQFLPSWDVDVEGLLSTAARLIYVCSPNNPTGTAAARASVQRLLDESDAVVIVDEAYGEFGGESLLGGAAAHPRLLVVRTLSKAFGLAGLRIGYGLGSTELIQVLSRAFGPYKVNALAEQAGIAALTHDLEWVRQRVAEVQRNRARFQAALQAHGLNPLPSCANFVLLPVADAASCAQRLRARGVGVRAFCALPGVGDAIRISIAPWEELDVVLGALEAGAP